MFCSTFLQDTEGLVQRLYQWAESETTPPLLQSYATGLLASAMEVQDTAANFREANARLVPAMLRRLWQLAQVSGRFLNKGKLNHFFFIDKEEGNLFPSVNVNERTFFSSRVTGVVQFFCCLLM